MNDAYEHYIDPQDREECMTRVFEQAAAERGEEAGSAVRAVGGTAVSHAVRDRFNVAPPYDAYPSVAGTPYAGPDFRGVKL